MTKEEYIEFTNLQEHYEWLHGAADRAKTKLKTFTTDDSEFDALVHEAIKVYFETEIDKAWKQIEEFKTGIAFVADREDAIRYCPEKRDDILVFVDNELDIYQQLKRSDVKEALKVCESGPCGHSNCPLRSIPGCTTILRMYKKGKYDVAVKIKEE